jgi:hypothetical protein
MILFIFIIILILISIYLFFKYLAYIFSLCKEHEYRFQPCNKYEYKNNYKIEVYVLSWKKVTNNAIKIFDELNKEFENVYFIDCDENSKTNFKNIIRLDDSAYYGKQFDTAINNANPDSIVGIVVGDIYPNLTDWKTVYKNMVDSFENYDIGIYAPYETRTHWHVSNGKINNTNYHLTKNTDCTVWFLAPYIVSFAKTLNISNISKLGWGIDSVLCNYSNSLGHHNIFDKSVKVTNPIGNNYSSYTASQQKYSLEKSISHILPSKPQKRKVHFISFSNDETKYKKILQEARDIYFDTITCYTEKSPELQHFFNKHKTFFEKNKRGYGYWIWKPYIVSIKLKEINSNDIILYADSACELNKEYIKSLKQHVDLATLNDLVVFKEPFKEYEFTKSDILKELGCYYDECYNKYQITASIFLTRNCNRMVKFFNKMNDLCVNNDYHLVKDSPSKTSNISGFKENHVQSLFSVLIKTMLKDKVMILENEIRSQYCKISNGGIL